MWGTKTWVPWMTPQRLTPRTRAQFSAGPNIPLPGWMPALFISTSTAAEAPAHRRFQRRHRHDVADIGFHRHDAANAAGRNGGDFLRRFVQPIAAEIGNADMHSQGGEAFRRRQPDAGRAAGDDGDSA